MKLESRIGTFSKVNINYYRSSSSSSTWIYEILVKAASHQYGLTLLWEGDPGRPAGLLSECDRIPPHQQTGGINTSTPNYVVRRKHSLLITYVPGFIAV